MSQQQRANSVCDLLLGISLQAMMLGAIDDAWDCIDDRLQECRLD
jgi:hypothetical protein